jgi:nitrate reductase gamma subunit
MRGKWLQRVRLIHTWLGVFFSPLLLLFIVTGWYQTFVSSDDADKNSFNRFMSKISNIHTDDYFAAGPGDHHASRHFQIYVAFMAAMLIFTIVLGVALACQNKKRLPWVALAFVLGILVPGLILYFN